MLEPPMSIAIMGLSIFGNLNILVAWHVQEKVSIVMRAERDISL